MTVEGMNLELLEQYLRSHRPKLLYDWYLAQSYGANDNTCPSPTVACSSGTVRVSILEDNAYEGLNFEPVPSHQSFRSSHLVTYISTSLKP